MMDEKEWLAGLKPGDEVAVYLNSWEAAGYKILTIDRVTATQLVMANDDRRFRRDTGYVIGQGYTSIHQVTQKMRDNVEAAKIVEEFREMFRPSGRDCVKKIPLNVLRAMKKAYDEEITKC